MEIEKSHREKIVAILSVTILVVDFLFILNDVVVTFLTRQYFWFTFDQIGPDRLPFIPRFVVLSIPTIVYCIFVISLILILALKELYLRSKTITLAINIIVGIATIAYIPFYYFALYLPIFSLANN